MSRLLGTIRLTRSLARVAVRSPPVNVRQVSSVLPRHEYFENRHIGPSKDEQTSMLKECGLSVGLI